MKTYLLAALAALALAAPVHATAPTTVASTAAPSGYAVVPASFTFVACDASNGNSFVNTGRQVLIAFNSDASAHSITVASVADSAGRTGDSTKNINAGAYYVFQFFPLNGWNQTDGTIHTTCSDATLKLAVITFP